MWLKVPTLVLTRGHVLGLPSMLTVCLPSKEDRSGNVCVYCNACGGGGDLHHFPVILSFHAMCTCKCTPHPFIAPGWVLCYRSAVCLCPCARHLTPPHPHQPSSPLCVLSWNLHYLHYVHSPLLKHTFTHTGKVIFFVVGALLRSCRRDRTKHNHFIHTMF